MADPGTEPERYLRILMGGPLGAMVDVCRSCGVLLPRGDPDMPAETTPQFVHDAWHEAIAAVAQLVHARERDDEERMERDG